MENETLRTEYPKELERMKYLLEVYASIPYGRFDWLIIEDLIKRAEDALLEQDIVKMISLYQEMKESRNI